MQIFDDFSLRISHHDADKNQIDADLENSGRVARFDFRFPGFLRSGGAASGSGTSWTLRGSGCGSGVASRRFLTAQNERTSQTQRCA